VNAILIDAGPLVALLHRDDQHHQKCVEAVTEIRDPLVTVWSAFTEAMYLLNFSWRAQDALWELILDDTVRLLPVETDDHRRMQDLMKKYRMLPMDVADAALLAVAERERTRPIFTIDRRDFSLYRPAKLGKFMIVP
jgi:uncharacterized protein